MLIVNKTIEYNCMNERILWSMWFILQLVLDIAPQSNESKLNWYDRCIANT